MGGRETSGRDERREEGVRSHEAGRATRQNYSVWLSYINTSHDAYALPLLYIQNFFCRSGVVQPMVIGEDGRPRVVEDVQEYLHTLEQANRETDED